MTTLVYRSWVAAGRPFQLARPVADLARTLRAHGYTIGTIGNESHLQHDPPEDHTPFSATGWPDPSPYPFPHALDIMPPKAGSGLPSLAALGAQLVADRQASYPGALWIKYVNWTRADGQCVHESWQPAHAVRPSSDVGHIHVSARTDFTHSGVAQAYDPVARLLQQAAVAPHPVPPWPGRVLRYVKGRPMMRGDDVRHWQERARARRYTIDVDGIYGPQSERVAELIQRKAGLRVDGAVGPRTWDAT